MKIKLIKKLNNKPSSNDLFPEGVFEAELRGDSRSAVEFAYDGVEYILEEITTVFEEDFLCIEGGLKSPSSFLGRFLFKVEDVKQ
jgi:hypothetical protein